MVINAYANRVQRATASTPIQTSPFITDPNCVPSHIPDAKDKTGNIDEFQKGIEDITFIVMKPWVITKKPRIVMMTLKNNPLLVQGKPPITKGARCNTPNPKNKPMKINPRESSDFTGCKTARHALIGLPKYSM